MAGAEQKKKLPRRANLTSLAAGMNVIKAT
jgi:hypothetical protein